jgi:CheY-like chemotaxis protein
MLYEWKRLGGAQMAEFDLGERAMQDIQVLFVDDERNVLNALERNLIRESYQKRFVGSGVEALASMAAD